MEKNTISKEVRKKMQLSDKDMAKDMELMMKQMIQSCSTAEINASNKNLRNQIGQLCGEIKGLHSKLSNMMSSRGWSKTAVASQQAIESEIITWEQKPLREPELTQ
jgi:spore coat protein CotF